ncbi:MAG: hypothetical protein U9N42_03530 [Campylobacterota bacterium]|nr:hypothetical protein [Campylobacterota bacterium]
MSNIFDDGKKYIYTLLGVWIACMIFDCGFFTFLAFVGLVFMVLVFYKRERVKMNFQDGSIYSPCEGSINSIEKLSTCSEFKDGCTKIVIENECLSHPLFCAPIDGVMGLVHRQNGAFLKTSTPQSEKLNEKLVVKFKNDNMEIICEHIVSKSFDGIHLHVNDGATLQATDNYGLMVYGTTTLYIPKEVKLNVRVNQKLRVKESVLN